jgi:hypothetical protein
MTRRAWGLVLLLAPLATAGCSKTVDAYFANGCSHAISIATYDVRRVEPPANARATVRARSVVKVEDAFSDAAGHDWLVIVDGRHELPVDGEKWAHNTVVIPTEMCRNE